jgi:hypothetical protein
MLPDMAAKCTGFSRKRPVNSDDDAAAPSLLLLLGGGSGGRGALKFTFPFASRAAQALALPAASAARKLKAARSQPTQMRCGALLPPLPVLLALNRRGPRAAAPPWPAAALADKYREGKAQAGHRACAQVSQTAAPQLRQWWRRRKKAKVALHSSHLFVRVGIIVVHCKGWAIHGVAFEERARNTNQ